MKTTIKNAIAGLTLVSFVFSASLTGIGQSEFVSTNPEEGLADVSVSMSYFESQQYLPEDHRSDVIMDRDAEFFGGSERVAMYLRENFDYPAYARDNGIEGQMKVRFDIDEKGKVTNVRIIKGLHRSLDNELKRTIESMPNWIPALRYGFPAKSTVEMPFKATLL